MSASRGISVTASQIFSLASPQYTLATTVSCTSKNLRPKNGHQDSCPRLTNTHITILYTAVTSENYPQNVFYKLPAAYSLPWKPEKKISNSYPFQRTGKPCEVNLVARLSNVPSQGSQIVSNLLLF
jgi:hypothetical protein